MFEKATLKSRNSGAVPNQAAMRIARRLTSSPESLYLWLSGPAMTARERTRAEVADFRNSWARTLLGN